MTDLPHVIAGDHPTEEHIRVMEAYCARKSGRQCPRRAGHQLTAADYNAAVDWWNGLWQEAEAEELAEAVAQAWHYPDTGEATS